MMVASKSPSHDLESNPGHTAYILIIVTELPWFLVHEDTTEKKV